MNIKKTSLALASLAVAVSPVMASAASQNSNTTINATVNSVITAGTSSTVTLNITPTGSGVVTSASDTVTVSTNNVLGYNLTVADSDATTSLTNGGNTIVASAGTKTAPIALANNTWGIAVNTGTTGIGTNGFDASYAVENNSGSSTSKWAGVPASGSPMTLKSTSSTATNDTTTVWYGAKVTSATPNGTYSDTVVYTATTN
jgi:hypothetical protein